MIISANKKRPENNSFLSHSPAGTVVLYVIVFLLYSRASFVMLNTNRNCSPATCWGLRFPKPSYGFITARFHSLCRAKGELKYLKQGLRFFYPMYHFSDIFAFELSGLGLASSNLVKVGRLIAVPNTSAFPV